MSRAFLNWEPIERKKRGAKYLAWVHDGKQKLYKAIIPTTLPSIFQDHVTSINKDLDRLIADAKGSYYRRRSWAKASDEQISMFKSALLVLLNDVNSFIVSSGGTDKWALTTMEVKRSWSDPNIPFAWLKVGLKHLDSDKPFTMQLGFGLAAQAKRVRCIKTQYDIVDAKITNDRNSESCPFAASLPLGGHVKLAKDGSAKDAAELTLSQRCSGNIPRFWDICCTVIDLLTSDHYKYFSKAISTCNGQFSEMALKTLQELLTINQRSISYDCNVMNLGDKMTIRFLNIPDMFEENPEDRIEELTDNLDEEDDDE